jgi:hypothetical protein
MIRPTSSCFRQLSCSYQHRVPPRLIRHQSTSAGTASKAIDDGHVSEVRPFQLPPYHEGKNRYDWRFGHGISDYRAERLTVREIAMVGLMDSITDKKMWHHKIFDEAIVSKWREEAQAMPSGMISDKVFDWCVKELRDKSKDYEQDSFVTAVDSGTRCVKSDVLISETLGNDLRRAVEPLLAVSDDQKDWHPHSDGKVLNLVHPSLYPLVCGRSKSTKTGKGLESMGEGEIVEQGDDFSNRVFSHGYADHNNLAQLCSTRFQWLPSEVQFVSDKGTDVQITSYINNLHPIKHKELYRIIEKTIGRSIPLWNSALVMYFNLSPGPRIKAVEGICDPREPPFREEIFDHEVDLSQLAPQIKTYLNQPDNPQLKGNLVKRMELSDDPKQWDVNEVSQAIEEVYYRTRKIIHPEPGELKSYELWKSSQSRQCIEDMFRKRGLQVIVKLSSIELTPEKPDYAGGSWHLEGMLNEGIVATSIYYYDIDNVTESRIRFSQEADLDPYDLQYEQSDHDPLCITFGTESMCDEPAVQEIGSIATRHGRIIAFPNTMRHKVEPFGLADRTKPGHRRYLVLWLVDPHMRIMSTADVPPQQLSWAEGTRMDEASKGSLMTLEEAKAYRLELMKERTSLNDAVEDNVDLYNLCEH